MPHRRPTDRRPTDRRLSQRREIWGTLAFALMIFVSILALPFGRVHQRACEAVTRVAGREVPCGLSELSISIDTDRHPYISIAVTPLKLPISL
jgi:hypothetical protein